MRRFEWIQAWQWNSQKLRIIFEKIVWTHKWFFEVYNIDRIWRRNNFLRNPCKFRNRYFRKKNRFDVHLFQLSIENDDDDENNFVIHEFHYKDENFIVIEVFSLFEVANDSMSFVTNDFVIEIFFQFENSFVIENFIMNWAINEILNVILD